MPDATSPMTFFDVWKDMSQQSSTLWSQAATAFQPPDAAQQWRHRLTLWTDFWSNMSALALSPEISPAAQKRYAEHIETLAQNLANIMGTEAFAAMQSKCFEQQLAWQDKFMKATYPHMDMALRTFNLPSRQQIDRLFERLIGLEERFDTIEAKLRQCLNRLPEQSTAAVTDPVTDI